MAHDDDLEMWDDDPLVRALRAPGTPSELAGEAEALAGFRSAVPRRSRRRLARRMGTGAGTFAVAVALSGGVAAAYTHTLPDPVQRVAHTWFGGIGVGAPTAGRATTGHSGRAHSSSHGSGGAVAPVDHPSSPSAPSTSTPHSAVPTPATGADAAPGGSKPAAHPSASAGSKAPTGPAPVTPPKPTPTASRPSQPRLVPAAMTGSVSAQRIAAASSVTMSGRLTTSSGAAVPDRRVVVQSRPAGAHQRWSPVATTTTDSDGDVTIGVPGLSRTTRLRLRAPRGVHSAVATVVVVPALQASVSRAGDQYDVTVTSTGLQQGDTLVVARRLRGRHTVVDRVTVDSAGDASFTVGVPPKRDVTFHVLAHRSAAHAAAVATFVAPRA
jgi:hypothetical protein